MKNWIILSLFLIVLLLGLFLFFERGKVGEYSLRESALLKENRKILHDKDSLLVLINKVNESLFIVKKRNHDDSIQSVRLGVISEKLEKDHEKIIFIFNKSNAVRDSILSVLYPSYNLH